MTLRGAIEEVIYTYESIAYAYNPDRPEFSDVYGLDDDGLEAMDYMVEDINNSRSLLQETHGAGFDSEMEALVDDLDSFYGIWKDVDGEKVESAANERKARAEALLARVQNA